MWSIFGVKLNHIVIFEKSCNSSTLLIELFTICDLIHNSILNRCSDWVVLVLEYLTHWLLLSQLVSLIGPIYFSSTNSSNSFSLFHCLFIRIHHPYSAVDWLNRLQSCMFNQFSRFVVLSATNGCRANAIFSWCIMGESCHPKPA